MYKTIEIIVYNTTEQDEEFGGMSRIQYKGHVIQIFCDGATLWHCVISKDGQTVLFETDCLLKAVKYIEELHV